MIIILIASLGEFAARFAFPSRSTVMFVELLFCLTLPLLFLFMCLHFLLPLDVTAAPPLTFLLAF